MKIVFLAPKKVVPEYAWFSKSFNGIINLYCNAKYNKAKGMFLVVLVKESTIVHRSHDTKLTQRLASLMSTGRWLTPLERNCAKVAETY